MRLVATLTLTLQMRAMLKRDVIHGLMERKFQRMKVPGNESSLYGLFAWEVHNYSRLDSLLNITNFPVRVQTLSPLLYCWHDFNSFNAWISRGWTMKRKKHTTIMQSCNAYALTFLSTNLKATTFLQISYSYGYGWTRGLGLEMGIEPNRNRTNRTRTLIFARTEQN